MIVMSHACLPGVLSKDIRLTGLNFEKKNALLEGARASGDERHEVLVQV